MLRESLNCFLSQTSGDSSNVTRGNSFASTVTTTSVGAMENRFSLSSTSDVTYFSGEQQQQLQEQSHDNDKPNVITLHNFIIDDSNSNGFNSTNSKYPCWEPGASPRRQRIFGRSRPPLCSSGNVGLSNEEDIFMTKSNNIVSDNFSSGLPIVPVDDPELTLTEMVINNTSESCNQGNVHVVGTHSAYRDTATLTTKEASSYSNSTISEDLMSSGPSSSQPSNDSFDDEESHCPSTTIAEESNDTEASVDVESFAPHSSCVPYQEDSFSLDLTVERRRMHHISRSFETLRTVPTSAEAVQCPRQWLDSEHSSSSSSSSSSSTQQQERHATTACHFASTPNILNRNKVIKAGNKEGHEDSITSASLFSNNNTTSDFACYSSLCPSQQQQHSLVSRGQQRLQPHQQGHSYSTSIGDASLSSNNGDHQMSASQQAITDVEMRAVALELLHLARRETHLNNNGSVLDDNAFLQLLHYYRQQQQYNRLSSSQQQLHSQRREIMENNQNYRNGNIDVSTTNRQHQLQNGLSDNGAANIINNNTRETSRQQQCQDDTTILAATNTALPNSVIRYGYCFVNNSNSNTAVTTDSTAATTTAAQNQGGALSISTTSANVGVGICNDIAPNDICSTAVMPPMSNNNATVSRESIATAYNNVAFPSSTTTGNMAGTATMLPTTTGATASNNTVPSLPPRNDFTEILKSLNVDEKILQKIDHSAKFVDDVYEYRFVMLPRNHPFFDFEADVEIRERLMTEAEWRAIGIRQTRGWEHFGFSRHETHVFLFRRPIGTDPRTGKVNKTIQEHVEKRLSDINQTHRELITVQNLRFQSTVNATEDSIIRTIPAFGSAQSAGPTDPSLPLISVSPVGGTSPVAAGNLNGQAHRLTNWITGRNLAAAVHSAPVTPQPSTAFFDLKPDDYEMLEKNEVEEYRDEKKVYDDDIEDFEMYKGDQVEEGTSLSSSLTLNKSEQEKHFGRRECVNEVDKLYAALHMPLYAI